MLYIIKNESDQYFTFLKDDPVRGSIPHLNRIGINKEIFTLIKDDRPAAITCVNYLDNIPSGEEELFKPIEKPTVAVFYTIWSYAPKSGRELLFSAVDYVKENKPDIKRFATLSPKTDLAARFHLKNGAVVYRVNSDSINYEYKF